MLVRRLSQAACGLAFLFSGATLALAGSFSVSPVRVALSDSSRIVSITVRNSGDAPAVIQVETVSWSQADGRDVYARTREILATPPIFTVPAGRSQVVRVGLRRTIDAQRELPYRVFFQEVPPPAKPGFQGLRVALRIGVPVFVAPAARAAPVLDWRAYVDAGGALVVSVANSGNAHVRIASISFRQERTNLGAYQIGAYVLPGQRRAWRTNIKRRPAAGLKVFAQTDAGDMQANVVIQKP